jgi:hypothetical protein
MAEFFPLVMAESASKTAALILFALCAQGTPGRS